MTIVCREHRAQFTIIPNVIFRDDRPSIEAKGVSAICCHARTTGRSALTMSAARCALAKAPASPANKRRPPVGIVSAKSTTLFATCL
jgi:hypothetical protein